MIGTRAGLLVLVIEEIARDLSIGFREGPEVSTMLMCVPFQVTAQFLARIVMPRSFSMALLSITVSTTFSCSAKVPDWRSSWSTIVVLPWSTWAMMAMLRI